MHAIVLNLVRTELLNHLLADLGANSSVAPLDRDPQDGGLLNRSELAAALNRVDWTTELRDGRVPSITQDKQQGMAKLAHWKAEEYSKFMLVAPVVLRNLIPNKSYDCFMLLVAIHRLVFSRRLRSQGWTEEHRSYFKRLLWSHAIQYEELYGLAACCENVEYSLHMPEDVERHSLLDNYWCYLYERLVKYYKQQSSNMKALCKTFADRAAQLRFVNTFLCTHCTGASEVRYPESVESEGAHVLTASSLEAAIKLKNSLNQERTNQHIQENSIFLGRSSFKILSDRELADIQYWLRNVGDLGDLPNACRTYSRFLGTGDYDLSLVYRVGENIIATDAVHPDREWLATITHIMVYGPVNNQYHYFFKGTFFTAIQQGSGIHTDTDWTNQPFMVRREFHRLCVYPLKAIDRKVIVYPTGVGATFLTIDLDPVVTCVSESAKIPYLPKSGDVVKVSEGRQTFLLLVKTVLVERHSKVQGYRLRKVRGTPVRWKLLPSLSTFLINSIVSEPIPHHVNAEFYYMD